MWKIYEITNQAHNCHPVMQTKHLENAGKGNSNTKRLAYMSLVVRLLNMGPRAGIRKGRGK